MIVSSSNRRQMAHVLHYSWWAESCWDWLFKLSKARFAAEARWISTPTTLQHLAPRLLKHQLGQTKWCTKLVRRSQWQTGQHMPPLRPNTLVWLWSPDLFKLRTSFAEPSVYCHMCPHIVTQHRSPSQWEFAPYYSFIQSMAVVFEKRGGWGGRYNWAMQ
jgi:hypothetical protein